MPKADKGRAAQKEESKKSFAPYSRDKAARGDKSTQPSEVNAASGGKRKRRKNKRQDIEPKGNSKTEEKNEESGLEAVTARAAGDEAASADPKGSSPQPKQFASTSEVAEPGPEQQSEDRSNKRTPERSTSPTSPEPKKKKTKHELRELRVQFKQAQDAAEAAQAELQKKIAELEKTVAEQAAQLETKTTTIDNTNKLLASMDEHRSNIKEALTCGICMDVINEPHALQCGHTACRTCLLQWFRSPNAYPAPDIETVGPEDDLTYRTKQCHLCRENVYIRPVRVFAVGDIAESMGLTRTKSSPEAKKIEGAPAAAKSETDLWAKTFPPDTTSYVTWDDADAVWRCPKCGCEVADGECQGCRAQFSDVEDSDGDDSEGDEDEDGDRDVRWDDDSDIEPEVYRPVIRTALPGRRPARDSDDDSVHASHLLNTLDLLADEASEEEGSYDSSDDEGGRGSSGSSPTPTSTPTLYPRRELYPDDEDLEAAGDEGYESSFIDDSNDEEEVEAEAERSDRGSESEVSVAGVGEHGGSEDEIEERVARDRNDRSRGGHSASRRVNDSDDDDGDEEVQAVDEPSVDELRARRAARFGGERERSNSSQPVQRRSRRVIDVSDDE